MENYNVCSTQKEHVMLQWLQPRPLKHSFPSWALVLHRSESRNCGLCVAYRQKYGATLLVGACMVTWKTTIRWTKSVRWCREDLKCRFEKINFCSRVLRLSVLPWCWERPQTVICCLKVFRMMDFTVWLWGWIEFFHYFRSVTFVVQTADQKVGRGDGALEQQKQDSHFV